jgi:hypothetical protein
VIDLTFGAGRFYRKSKHLIDKIIAVDIRRYEWEVKPTMFYQMNCLEFIGKVLDGEIELDDINIIVTDPPWSHEKRGNIAEETGISKQPYHLMGVNSRSIIQAALKLSKHISKPLLYRYKEPLNCIHLIQALAEIKIMRTQGWVYYGICLP